MVCHKHGEIKSKGRGQECPRHTNQIHTNQIHQQIRVRLFSGVFEQVDRHFRNSEITYVERIGALRLPALRDAVGAQQSRWETPASSSFRQSEVAWARCVERVKITPQPQIQ
jgi:hypothetical protein